MFRPSSAVGSHGSCCSLDADLSGFTGISVYRNHKRATCIEGVIESTGDVLAVGEAISRNIRGRARVSVSCLDGTGADGSEPIPVNCMSCVSVSREGVFRVNTAPTIAPGADSVEKWLSEGQEERYAVREFKRYIGVGRDEALRRLMADAGSAIDRLRQSMIPGDRAFAEAVCLETGLRVGWISDYDRAFPVYYPDEVEEPGKPPVPLRKWLASA